MQPNGPYWRCYVKRREYRKEADKRYRDSLKGYLTRRGWQLRVKRAFWEERLEELS